MLKCKSLVDLIYFHQTILKLTTKIFYAISLRYMKWFKHLPMILNKEIMIYSLGLIGLVK